MSSDYLPIDSSNEGHSKDERKTRPKISTFFLTAFLLIMMIATFFAAQVIIQLFYKPNMTTSPYKSQATLKSLPVSVTNGTKFRNSIGGRWSCSRRVSVASSTSPTDANQVRPADIQYIAALGDSFMTGYLSYTSQTEHQAVDEMRNVVGNSFAMGGDGELETHLTVANIFRKLNPALVGFSTGLGLDEQQTNLNVAVPGMWVDDLPRQARELIRRMENYSVKSVKNDWKLIHIFAGTRDISGFCMGQGGTTKQEYKRNLTETIEILQNALPRTIISIIGVANFDFLWNAENSIAQSSKIGFKMAGPCQIADSEIVTQRRIEEYREANVEIVSEKIKDRRSKSRKDHAVIVQHIFDDLWGPLRRPDGSFYTDFYAADSFHLSNYGNSLVAKQLWNQLISPDSRKLTNNDMMSDENEELLCPEIRCPFIRTPSNSIACEMSEENMINGAL